MEDQKKGVEDIRTTIADKFKIPEFDPTLVNEEVVLKELKKHQDAYMSSCVSSRIELKFLNDSIDAIEKIGVENPEGLATAQKHLERSKTNPKYYETIKVDQSCMKALGHLQNIESKMTEVKNQLWAIEYHSDKIAEVRGYLALVK